MILNYIFYQLASLLLLCCSLFCHKHKEYNIGARMMILWRCKKARQKLDNGKQINWTFFYFTPFLISKINSYVWFCGLSVFWLWFFFPNWHLFKALFWSLFSEYLMNWDVLSFSTTFGIVLIDGYCLLFVIGLENMKLLLTDCWINTIVMLQQIAFCSISLKIHNKL